MAVLPDSGIERRTGIAVGERERCDLSLAIMDRNGDAMLNPELAGPFQQPLLLLGQLCIESIGRPREGKRRCDRARDHWIDPVIPIYAVLLRPGTRIRRHCQRVVVIASWCEAQIGKTRKAVLIQSSSQQTLNVRRVVVQRKILNELFKYFIHLHALVPLRLNSRSDS